MQIVLLFKLEKCNNIAMLYRKAYRDIDKWYKSDKGALLVTGARQVGKTTLIKHYLEENDIDHVSFDLIGDKMVREVFDTSNNAEDIMFRLSGIAKKDITPHKTIIYIDEIQAADDALTVIKYLVMDKRYRFIFSGSLLGVKIKDIESVPVGFMSILDMYPLDFEEFLIAININTSTYKYLEDCFKNRKEVDTIIHKQMMDLFTLYMCVGGMPSVVDIYLKTNDLRQVQDTQRDIDSTYRLDISKYDKDEGLLIKDIYDLIPSELNAQNKRFILKDLNEKARFYKYEESFVWLVNSGVGLFVYNVDNAVYPLLASKERTLFKLFLCDTGILMYKLLGKEVVSVLNGNINMNYGAIYESIVAQELKAHDHPLYYFNNKKTGEVDFLIEEGHDVIPIEVKSGKDYKRHSALDNLLKREDSNFAYVLCNDNTKVINKKIYLPIYMIMFIKKEDMTSPMIYTPNISSNPPIT